MASAHQTGGRDVHGSVAVQPGSRDEAAVGYQWLRRSRRVLAVCDVLASAASLVVLMELIRFRPMGDGAVRMAQIGTAMVLVLTMLLGFRNGQYSNSRRLTRAGDAGRLASHLLMAMCVTAVIALATKGFFLGTLKFSRLDVGVALCVFFLLGSLSRFVLSCRQRAQFMQGESFRRVLVLGGGRAADDFIHFLAKRPWLGIGYAGRVEYRAEHSSDADPDTEAVSPTYDGLENLDRLWVRSKASEVVVALDPAEAALLPDVAKLLCLAHVPFRVVPSLFEQSFRAAELMGYAELPVIDVDVDPLDRAERTFKRGLDLVLSGLVTLAVLLPGLALAAAIKLDSRGPVFYKQERLGRNGRRFGMYKFRTMVVNADARIEELADQNEKGGGQIFKMKNDPRITRVGRLLRKWSLDELPQVINVYKGDMSLVGPRPPLAREVENYQPEHFVRLKGLPGITGLWQVSGRSDLSFEEMVKLDKYYLDNWSLRLDLSIIVRTFVAVATRNGAY